MAKLADREGARQAIVEFGLPVSLAGTLGLTLPVAELAAAAALIPTASATEGSIVALALLLLFSVGISANLARGRKPDCHCFGQIRSGPVGWSTLGRNAVLVGGASAVAWAGPGSGHDFLDWFADLGAGEVAGLVAGVVLFALVVLEGWLLINLLHQNGRLLTRLEALEARLGLPVAGSAATGGLPVGTQAPDFRLSDLRGAEVTLESLSAAAKPVVLIFTDPDCGPCTELLPDVRNWQRQRQGEVTIAVISGGSADEVAAQATEYGLTNVLLQHNHEITNAYEARSTPSAVVVGIDGKIASAVGAGPDAVRRLLSEPLSSPLNVKLLAGDGGSPAPPPSAKVGEPAPTIELPDLTGETVRLSNLRGSAALLLFWNPECGFCRQMLPELKEWEAARPRSPPQLLVVSEGTAEANRVMGLRSPIVLDQDFNAGRLFGAAGTPTAPNRSWH
jgi:peroxiredoxin